ncbi:hypothetical protein CRE_02450 [Caenorhabditis remanei]|uniref:Uncharacterized protein n=1 Tax=Caenorhabditis remanei TaxID=31234 RepID=E3MIU4_CAERE|nr:hypothetical protein CRE_02450 [Caenorhabditis remanei]
MAEAAPPNERDPVILKTEDRLETPAKIVSEKTTETQEKVQRQIKQQSIGSFFTSYDYLFEYIPIIGVALG